MTEELEVIRCTLLAASIAATSILQLHRHHRLLRARSHFTVGAGRRFGEN